MMEYDTFWGLDQATWLDIFSLLKVLVPGLVMVCFGVYYQLRKKTETAIKIEIAKFRIFAYTDIAYTYSKLANLDSVCVYRLLGTCFCRRNLLLFA